jgi:hypothetical protein
LGINKVVVMKAGDDKNQYLVQALLVKRIPQPEIEKLFW